MMATVLQTIRRRWRTGAARAALRGGGLGFQAGLEVLEVRCLLSFAAPVSYNVGTQNDPFVPNAAPINVATADFNADSRLDLVVAHTVDDTVYVLLGNGNGTFQNAVAYATGEVLQGDVFVGDFTGDGRLDLFLPAGGTGSNNFTTHPVILPGNGNGGFGAKIVSSSFGPSRGWAVGDFNGDSRLDVVCTNPTAFTVTVLLNNGNGTFQNGIVSPPLFSYSRWVTAGDFNHDGKLDLAVANGVGNGTQTGQAQVTILLGNGNGTFRLGGNYASPGIPGAGTLNPEDVIAADLNQDGKLDLVVSDYDVNINVFVGNGDGTFQPPKAVDTGEYPRSVVVADFDRDGKMDLVVTNVGVNVGGAEFAAKGVQPGSVAVLLGNGNGTFQNPIQYSPFASPGWTAAGDFNGDGWPDLAVTRVQDGHSVNVMLNQPSGTTSSGTVRMYRAYNPTADYHFFTTSAGEFSNAVAHGYRDETTGRPGFAVLAAQAAGSTAIHRMYNPNSGRHYYTLGDGERSFLVSQGWRYEKDEGFMYPTQVAGTTEVYRLYNRLSGTHLFTEDASQKNAILTQLSFAWTQHTSLGFAFAASAAATAAEPQAAAPSTSAAAFAADSSAPVRISDGVISRETSNEDNSPRVSILETAVPGLPQTEDPALNPPQPAISLPAGGPGDDARQWLAREAFADDLDRVFAGSSLDELDR